MARLEGKNAIVTGAASGIGRASATLYAAEGANVICIDLEAAGLNETVSMIEAAGGQGTAIEASASDEDAIEAAVASCVEEHGRLDVFFANAGITGEMTPLFENSVDEWRKVLEVNLVGPFIAIKHAAPVMQKHGSGSILCTASVAGIRSGAGPAPTVRARPALSTSSRRPRISFRTPVCVSTRSAPA